MQYVSFGELGVVGGWVYLDYSVSYGPFWRFYMRFELLSAILCYSVCEIRDPSLTIGRFLIKQGPFTQNFDKQPTIFFVPKVLIFYP